MARWQQHTRTHTHTRHHQPTTSSDAGRTWPPICGLVVTRAARRSSSDVRRARLRSERVLSGLYLSPHDQMAAAGSLSCVALLSGQRTTATQFGTNRRTTNRRYATRRLQPNNRYAVSLAHSATTTATHSSSGNPKHESPRDVGRAALREAATPTSGRPRL